MTLHRVMRDIILLYTAWKTLYLGELPLITCPHLHHKVALELHFPFSIGPSLLNPNWGTTHMSSFFLHMANLGYAVISRDDNTGSPCCSEFSFLRVEKPRPHSSNTPDLCKVDTPGAFGTSWLSAISNIIHAI